MSIFRALFLCIASFLFFVTQTALAHEGHGLEGAHSHPSDIWGFLVLGMVIGLAVWFKRKK